MKTLAPILALSLMVPSLQAATIQLASTMNGNSYISEDAATGAFARINAGDGSLGSVGANTGDADGLYPIANVGNSDPGALLGTPVDLFPRETNFQVGSLTYNEAGLTGVGVEVRTILTLDLSAFWSPDPNRTNGTAGSAPTVISDISDRAIGLWLFDAPGSITFGALDATDTVTFTDGVLTSIDLDITTTFALEPFGMPLSFDGTFSITGASLSYRINDTAASFFGTHNLVANLTGTVNAVPEPSSAALLALGLSALMMRHRSRKG